MYPDSLNNHLFSIKIGCHIVGKYINEITYPDETVSLAPTGNVQQSLYNNSIEYITRLEMSAWLLGPLLTGPFTLTALFGVSRCWMSYTGLNT